MEFRIGPAGNSDSFYEEGMKSSVQAPGWLRDRGLNAYEYSLGHGISLTEKTALAIREQAEACGVQVSVHAPYYINLASPDPEKREASCEYIVRSAERAKWLGGSRVVVHAGAYQKQDRELALRACREGLLACCRRLDAMGLTQIRLCPETMGRPGQIGGLAETLALCLADERLLPCVDFAHLHALSGGGLKTRADFARVLDEAENTLGLERARQMHIHFSAIEFTDKGEKRHRTFSEEGFGPAFSDLAPELVQRNYRPVIICECNGTQAEDAARMRDMLLEAERAAQYGPLPAEGTKNRPENTKCTEKSGKNVLNRENNFTKRLNI